MEETSKDAALIQVLAERLEKHRLPVLLELKEKVENGELLNDIDIEFLETVFEDAGKIKPLLDRHPEWQDLAMRMIALYNEITDQALKNQENADKEV